VISPATRGGDDAGLRGPRVGELEQRARAAIIEEALPRPEHKWMDQQDEHVYELLGQELADDLAAPQDHNVLAGLLPEKRDCLCELAGKER
jgi:hypothetical protein